MSSNAYQEGNVLTLIAPRALASGEGVLVGSIFGVAQHVAANAAEVETEVVGVFELPKLSTDVVTQGALLYWDNTNFRLTVTASGNTKVGVAVAAAGDGVTTVLCRLSAAF
ncbi:MAG: DUF2190 family protein [Planctomycetota bacterium]|nr:MAG: DUF2190 family protein [Planctomycetota bacterium]